MILLNLTRLAGEVEAALSTRRRHPSTLSWAWSFALQERCDSSAIVVTGFGPGVSLSSTKAHVTTGGGVSVLEPDRALLKLMAQHPVEVSRPSLVHRVRIDLAETRNTLEHQVDVADVSGRIYPLWQGLTSPALVNTLTRHLGLRSTLDVRCVGVDGEYVPLPSSLTTLLSSFFAASQAEHRAMEVELRRQEREGGDEALMLLLRRALATFGPAVERQGSHILARLQHTLGTATLSIATTTPWAQTLSATVAAPAGSMTMTSPDSLRSLIRNLSDPRCGVAAIDDAFVIAADSDVDLAGAVAHVAEDAIVALGRSASVDLSGGTLTCQMTTTDPHPGAHITAALRLVRLWERLLLHPPTLR